MSDIKRLLQDKFETFVDYKYIRETMPRLLTNEQISQLENQIGNVFANIQINMGDLFLPFMDNLTSKLKEENCDMVEREFETNEEFNICMNNMKTFGAELIDDMF